MVKDLLTFLDKVTKVMGKTDSVDVSYLDFQRAFDLANRDL